MNTIARALEWSPHLQLPVTLAWAPLLVLVALGWISTFLWICIFLMVAWFSISPCEWFSLDIRVGQSFFPKTSLT